MLGKTEFSLFDHSSSPESIGPPLPSEIQLPDTLLVGAGALGNGIALLAAQMPLRGRIHIVDKQDYADENLETCILAQADWITKPKATHLGDWLAKNGKLEVTGEKNIIETARTGAIASSMQIDLILNALDDVSARRDAQDMWPAVIIDGGINEVGAAVVQYRLDRPDMACIKCWFETPQVDEKKLQSQLTGLSLDSLTDMGRVLNDADVDRSAPEKREWVRQQAKDGKTVCSLISEATLATRLGVESSAGFKPSAPFVATAAAALVVAEAIKSILYPKAPITSMVQVASMFLGPELTTQKIGRPPSSSCQCVVHRNLIQRLHAKKGNKAPGGTSANSPLAM